MVDDWWPLSGQEGEEKEGLLHLILSLQQLPPGSAVRLPAGGVAPSLTGEVFLCRVNNGLVLELNAKFLVDLRWCTCRHTFPVSLLQNKACQRLKALSVT